MKVVGILFISVLFACASADNGEGDVDAPSAGSDGAIDGEMPTDFTTLSGRVFNGANDLPLEGATVRIDQFPHSEVTTGADGTYTLTVPADFRFNVIAENSGQVTRSHSLFLNILGRAGLDLTISPLWQWNEVATDVGLNEQSTTKGIVGIDFFGADSTGGHGVTLSANHASGFTMNDQGNWQQSNTLVSGGQPFLFFTNVDVGETTFTVNVSGQTCSQQYGFGVFDIEANQVTSIEVNCN